jgi:hypothetical protein
MEHQSLLNVRVSKQTLIPLINTQGLKMAIDLTGLQYNDNGAASRATTTNGREKAKKNLYESLKKKTYFM